MAAPVVTQDTAPAGAVADQEESAAHQALWKRVWADKRVEIAGLSAMLGVLTLVFFFQGYATRNARAFWWFRMAS